MSKTSLTIAETTCPPLGTEVAADLRNMLIEPDYRVELAGIADEFEAQNVRNYDDLETGKAAERALDLGCAACMLSDVCVVKETLEQKVSAGADHEKFMEAATMLASAPKWLNAARINRSGVDGVAMLTRLQSAEEAERAYAVGELPLESLIGQTTNHIKDELPAKEVSVLATHSKIAPDEPVTVQEISTPVATFDVMDVSEAIGFKGEPLGAHEYGNLASKLLNRMEETDANGQPQIFTAENKMQKVISKRGDATLFEMRMAGKNRMYFWVTHAPNVNPQIVIMGSHGGDESTQRTFIDNYTS